MFTGTWSWLELITVPPIIAEEIFTGKNKLTIGFYIDDGNIKAAPACQRAVLEVKGYFRIPRSYKSFVYLCDFHREQSWDHWLSSSHNGVAQYKSSILEMFKNIALSMTEEEYVTATDVLQRWVKAYRQEVFNVLVNTNIGVERQKKALKYVYLDMKKTKSLMVCNSCQSASSTRIVCSSLSLPIEKNWCLIAYMKRPRVSNVCRFRNKHEEKLVRVSCFYKLL
ncbi:unnamed protein product [Mytilus edulis]|uniref:Uncharacterized protein n=1 Tax=Mytilus edulis TaxID=6550 RepID=A0A8S3TBQ0_MYTED|nr:unnamed protein product [Mytilus edulis]